MNLVNNANNYCPAFARQAFFKLKSKNHSDSRKDFYFGVTVNKTNYCETLDCNHIISDSAEIWARRVALWKIYCGVCVCYSCRHHWPSNRTPTQVQLRLLPSIPRGLTFSNRTRHSWHFSVVSQWSFISQIRRPEDTYLPVWKLDL